jgi:hypothetical protein
LLGCDAREEVDKGSTFGSGDLLILSLAVLLPLLVVALPPTTRALLTTQLRRLTGD